MKKANTNIQLIINGCLLGKPLSQRKLFELKYGLVSAICNRYSGGKEDAQEMLNDTFYTVFRFIDRYDREMPFDPWLRKVCVNCCLQHLRKYLKKQKWVELEDFHLGGNAEKIPLPSTTDKDYMKLIAQLPRACKTVINLFVIEEYSHQEIADLLGISVGSSKSNLARARRLLYKMLEKDSRGKLKLRNM